MRRILQVQAALLILFFTYRMDLHAYIDPGTGSYIIQVAVAAIAAVGFGIKIFWGNIKKFFGNIFKKKK